MAKNNAITGFRGIIIFLIIFHHYSDRYSELFQDSMTITFPIVSQYGGMIGNVIFLIMTGYFMEKSLLSIKGGYKAMGRYAINRYWRFWPSYAMAVLCVFTTLSFYPLPSMSIDYKTAIIDFFLIYHPGVPNIDGAHWFLTELLIIQLLLSFVLIIKCLEIRKRVLIVLAVLSMLAFVAGSLGLQMLENRVYSVLYIYSVLTGVMLALVGGKNVAWIIVAITSFIFLLFFKTPRVSVLVIIFLVVFVLIVKYPHSFKFLEVAPIQLLGKVSFSWYLVHQNIGFVIMYYLLPKGYISEFWLLIPILATFVIAYMIDKIVEKLPRKIIN